MIIWEYENFSLPLHHINTFTGIHITLMTIYDKSDISNVSDAYLKQIE